MKNKNQTKKKAIALLTATMIYLLSLLSLSILTSPPTSASDQSVRWSGQMFPRVLETISEYGVYPWNLNHARLVQYKKNWKVELINHSEKQNEIINYAYDISNSKDFIYTLKAENGTLDPKRKSNVRGANGYWDWGLCQLNYQWHSQFIDSPEFNDWRKQIDYCWEVFKKRPSAFYGYFNRYKVKHFFKFNS